MSSIIKTVSYTADDAKQFRDKLGEHLGIHQLTVILKGGEQLEGILSEVGDDYIGLVIEESDLIIPVSNILYFRYSH